MFFNKAITGGLCFEICVNGDLKLGLVWILNGQKKVDLQMVWTNDRRCVKKHLKSGQKCPDFE